MSIGFKLLKNPSSRAVSLVFFAFEEHELSRYSLFKFLEKKEQDYFKNATRGSRPKDKEVKVYAMPGTGRKVFTVGLGREKDFTPRKAGFATRIAVQSARKEGVDKFAFGAAPVGDARATKNFYELVAANAVMANFEFVKYKTPPKEGFHFVKEMQAISGKTDKNISEGLRRGRIVGEEVNNCRMLANTPGGDMTPRILSEHARRDARGTGIKVKVFDEKKIRALKMGGILGVSKGSEERPRFIVMEYMKGPQKEKPIVLVGKGVTFDTGGLNLKPTEAIYEMHMDMSGGSAVMHTIRAAARLGIKRNIVGLVPAVENMPSGSSYHPGDVLRSMSGKTIEVLNTDAEGRIILADALTYAKKYNPALVVDVATLTGAAVVALGQRYSGLFTSDKKLEDKFRKLGEETGDAVWPLPLDAGYEDEIRGTFGDWANTGKNRWGGAITAAVFLWQWARDFPWVHLDIAPRMTTIEGEYLAKGAAGAPVRLLIKLLEEF